MHATFGASESMQATCVSSVTFRISGEYCIASCGAWVGLTLLQKSLYWLFTPTGLYPNNFTVHAFAPGLHNKNHGEPWSSPSPTKALSKNASNSGTANSSAGPLSLLCDLRYCGLYCSIRSWFRACSAPIKHIQTSHLRQVYPLPCALWALISFNFWSQAMLIKNPSHKE